jgi:hypothetical protein
MYVVKVVSVSESCDEFVTFLNVGWRPALRSFALGWDAICRQNETRL